MIFKNGYKITQKYGNNPSYYKQFGLAGHEGLDLIPTDSNWTIYAPEGGVIVRDIDDPRLGGAYGNLVVVLNKQNNRAWWFAHNAENYVQIGQEIKKGQILAKMGSTGNVTGAHVHLGIRLADENGNAINTNNGYQGFIDPLPILISLEPQENDALQACLKAHKEAVDSANKKDEEIKNLKAQLQKLQDSKGVDQKAYERMQKNILEKNEEIQKLELQVEKERQKQKEFIKLNDKTITELKKDIETFKDEGFKLEDKLSNCELTLTESQEEVKKLLLRLKNYKDDVHFENLYEQAILELKKEQKLRQNDYIKKAKNTVFARLQDIILQIDNHV